MLRRTYYPKLIQRLSDSDIDLFLVGQKYYQGCDEAKETRYNLIFNPRALLNALVDPFCAIEPG